MKRNFYKELLHIKKKYCGFFCLIDPDKTDCSQALKIVESCNRHMVDAILIGSSLTLQNNFHILIKEIKLYSRIPVVIFPGLFNCISDYADAILYLSVLSSRNPELIIGEQVKAAPVVKNAGIEAVGTAYLLVESGETTSVQFMSNSFPIPRNKPDIAAAHSLAAEFLGFKLIYLEAGSGARLPITNDMIKKVKNVVNIPVIVGGGIKTPEIAREKAEAGADFIVVGSAIEEDFSDSLIQEFSSAIHDAHKSEE